MGSRLDKAVARHVAQLARLAVTEDELSRYTEQLASVLDYVAKLNELDTADVPPTAHALPIHNVLREDEVRPGLTQDEALHNAPKTQDRCFRVPKVLDQEGA